jgi:cation diffusion facilitator CzcD-associated flavoprotein CzcO
MLEYLQSYADHYNIIPSIKFGTRVDQIQPVTINEVNITNASGVHAELETENMSLHGWRFKDNVRWKVTTQDVETSIITSEEYDAVLVCNG